MVFPPPDDHLDTFSRTPPPPALSRRRRRTIQSRQDQAQKTNVFLRRAVCPIGVVDRLDSQSTASRRHNWPSKLQVHVQQLSYVPSTRGLYVRYSVLEVQLPIGIKGESGSGLRSKMPRMYETYIRVYSPTHTHTHTYTWQSTHPINRARRLDSHLFLSSRTPHRTGRFICNLKWASIAQCVLRTYFRSSEGTHSRTYTTSESLALFLSTRIRTVPKFLPRRQPAANGSSIAIAPRPLSCRRPSCRKCVTFVLYMPSGNIRSTEYFCVLESKELISFLRISIFLCLKDMLFLANLMLNSFHFNIIKKLYSTFYNLKKDSHLN